MKLKVSSESAVQLLQKRIAALRAADFDSKVWQDRTVLDVQGIFGGASTEWLSVSSLKFNTYISADKEKVMREGKVTAQRLLESFIEYIHEHTSIERAAKQEVETTYKAKYDKLLGEWNEFVPLYNKILNERKAFVEEKVAFEEKVKNNSVSSGPIKILFLGANPDDQTRLRIDREVKEIDAGLRRANERDSFTFHQRWAVSPHDIQQALLDFNPDIVHFSGHGEVEGILAEEANGQTQLVSTDALSELFDLFQDKVRCVILNSCLSLSQAVEIAKHIPFVVGMNNNISDDTAINFSLGFYAALGAGRDIEFAFKMGLVSIKLTGLAGADIPQFFKRT